MHTNMRRSIVLIAIVVVAAAASVVASAMATRKVPKRIEVPGTPLAIASGHGSLWVAGHDGTTLYRINPRTGRIRARIAEGTNACGPLGIAYGRVWIGHCDTGTTDAVVSVRSNRLVGRVKALAYGFGFGFGSAWVDAPQQNPSILNRLDPENLRVLDRIQVGDGIGNAVGVAGFMWCVNTDGTLSQIQPDSNRVVATIRYGGGGPAYGVVAAGKIWILDEGDNALYKFDPRNRSVAKLPVRLSFSLDFGDPYIAVAGRRIWFATHNPRVAGGGIDRLAEISAETGRVLRRLRLPFGFGPYFAIIHHSLWGALPGEDLVVRIPLK